MRTPLAARRRDARLLGALLLATLAPACGARRAAPDPAIAAEGPRRPAATERAATAEGGGPDTAEGARRDEVAPTGAARAGEDARPAAGPEGDARPALEVLEGRASFYADRFHGRPTASGEPYDMHALTAASRDLPFGTIVRVVRVETGASVVVRVNDRGPFRDARRILDLSRAAAEALDMVRAGVVEVRAEILERGDGRRWRGRE